MGARLTLVPGGLSGHRIGPNAIIRVAEALRTRDGEQRTREVFVGAGLARYLERPPGQMVDEREVLALHLSLRAALGRQAAREIECAAGHATARYLLAHRIPRPFQLILRGLPGSLAGPLLLAAILRHSWTFAGSARVTARYRPTLCVAIENNPMCRGDRDPDAACSYYAATFESLFRALVGQSATVSEVQCEARGDSQCCFTIVVP